MSIIFYLNKDLLVLEKNVNSVEEIAKIEREGNFLNLTEKFQKFWDSLKVKNDQKIYFIVGDEAGFTDTRVVFIWLKTWSMFNPQSCYYIHKLEDFINVSDNKEISTVIEAMEIEKNQELVYSKAPRIGENKY